MFDPAIVQAYVEKRVPGACLVEDMGLELYFQLPSDEIRTGNFTKLFNDLDTDLSKLGISSYGIADTTLEEVFLKVADATGVDEDLNFELKRQQVDSLTDGKGVYMTQLTTNSAL